MQDSTRREGSGEASVKVEKRKRSESSFDGNYERRVPLGSRPLPNIPAIKRPPPVAPKPSRHRSADEEVAPVLERSSSRLSETVRKAARNSSRNHLLRNSMKSIVDQKTPSSSDVLKPVVSSRTKKKKGKKKKKNSQQIRKTNQALEYAEKVVNNETESSYLLLRRVPRMTTRKPSRRRITLLEPVQNASTH